MSMTDDEFKKKLSEVAEWKLPDTPREGSLNQKKKRGRKSAEEIYQETREQIFQEEFGGVNPTYAPLLLRLKYIPIECECGRTCLNGCEKEAKLYEKGKKQYWREKCKTCGMTKDPYTGDWNLNSQKASVVWHSFMRETKGTSQSKGNIAKGIVKPQQPINSDTVNANGDRVIQNGCEIITYFCGSKPSA